MKLFPENGNLLNSTQSHQSSGNVSSQSTSATAMMPLILNNSEAVNSLKSTTQSMPLSSLVVDKSTIYPLEMECDPVSINPSIPLSSSTYPSRYDCLSSKLSSLNTSSSNSNINTSNLSEFNSDIHRNTKSVSNVLHDYAPNSLPIGVYTNSKSNNGALTNDAHSLAAYQHHLLVSTVGSNGNVSYIPYSMSNEAVNTSIPKNSNTITSSSSLSST